MDDGDALALTRGGRRGGEGRGGDGGATESTGDATPSPPPRLETLGSARLATPVARKADSIASQFQREILGELTATPQPPARTDDSALAAARDDIEINTPETFTARGTAAAERAAPEPETEEQKAGDSDGDGGRDYNYDDMRRSTLSPSKAALLAAASNSSGNASNVPDDSAISRRDTVSPQALKSLLQSISLDDSSPSAARRTGRSPSTQHTTAVASFDSSSDSASGAANQFLAAAALLMPSSSSSAAAALQTPESVRKTRAMKRKERDERTLSPSEALSMTLSDLAPVRAKAPSPSPESSSGTETLPDDEDEASGLRRATLEPIDATSFLSALRDEMHGESRDTDARNSSSSSRSQRRQTLGTAPSSSTDASPVTRSRSRRATVDPSDMRTMASARDDSDSERQTRRETVDADDLHELQSELHATPSTTGTSNSSVDTAMRVDESGSRKRQATDNNDTNDGDNRSPSPAGRKKTRSGGGDENSAASPPREAVVSIASRQATGLARPQKTPTPGKPPRGDLAGDGLDESAGRRSRTLERQSLLAKFSSPPAVARSTKTPLRGILSAKKPSMTTAMTTTTATTAAALSTPTKSVNFGPSQGAEFNLGSPSTSMTPMPAKDARRLFPLDRAASPPSLHEEDEDEDDEETSLNTSLLDEADAIDSDDDTTELVADARLSLAPGGGGGAAVKSPDKTRRRYSLRGVSPLDNQANARRWRRSSVGNPAASAVRSPVSARKIKGIGPGALAPPVPSPPSATKTSTSVFLSDPSESESAALQSRVAYADSSASSDAGEDMEITGDFSAFVQASGLLSASAQKAKAAMPEFRFRGRTKDTDTDKDKDKDNASRADDSLQGLQGDGDTVELGSLGDLVAESAAYDTSGAGGDNAPALGSLSALAREGDDALGSAVSAAAARRFGSLHYSQLDEQDVTLDPIIEEEEDATNSSAPSMMSLDASDDESDDAEYDERRKSLVVNLSSKFARVGSASPKTRVAPAESGVTAAELSARIQSPRRKSVAPPPPDVPLISMDELLTTVGVDTNGPPAAPDDHFRDLYASSSATADASVDAVKRAAIATACKDVVKWHMDELSSWSAGLTDVLASLLREPAPALFSPEVLDAAGVDAVRALHTLETARVQSGLCQWRCKMESEVAAKLASTAGELDKDARALRQRVSNDMATRASELGALQELIAREQQLAELLDAVEEQQAVQSEYAASVDALETQCAALALEASVLADQLRVAEAVASESDVVSAEAATELERQVLHAEEVSAIQSSLSLWRVVVATASHLKLSARLDDVVLTTELHVDVVLSDFAPSTGVSSGGGGFSTDVTSTVTLKRRRRSAHLASADADVVRLVQQKLFDPVQLSRFIRTATSSQHDAAASWQVDRPRRICALLHELERYVTLSFRFLHELRALSAQYAVEYIADGAVLWVEFLNFAPGREAKFVVGFALLDEFPFANFETSVDVVYGPVSPDAIRAEIDAEAAKQIDYEYISRICERLRNAFVAR